MNPSVYALISFIASHDGVADKSRLARLVTAEFNLTRDSSVYYSATYAIRFSSSRDDYIFQHGHRPVHAPEV